MLSCRELIHLVASDALADAGWSTRLQFRLHLLICRNCRRYVTQMGILGNMARRLWGPGTSDPAVLDRLEQRIIEALR
jgi:hypothetical protein